MAIFPQTSHFVGLNQPIGQEVSLKGLKLEGTLPVEVQGAFFRAVPDPHFPPKFDDDNVLSGDGMVSRVAFNADGTVDYDIAYVRTARWLAEDAAGRARFGRYRNIFTDDADVQSTDRTVANTTPVWHAGRLLMAKEDGKPYRVDPNTLETLGSYDFDGALKSETMTAHVRIDAQTGEMFVYGYEADGVAGKQVSYFIVDKTGKLIREQWFEAPYCAMMHDFAITQNYALFPIYPTTCDLERLKAGGDHWVHEMETDSWLGVMPRYGDVSEMRWFKGPKGVSAYHFMNAFEDENGIIHFDQCLSNTNAFPFIREASGIHMAPWDVKGALTRWSVDPKGDATAVTETIVGPPGDFPVIPATMQGQPNPYGWMLSMDPDMKGPPLAGGPVGAMFNCALRLDFVNGAPQAGHVVDALPLPPGMSFNEPVHVPSNDPAHLGWLVTVVDRAAGDSFEHEVWVLDGGALHKGPVARAVIPTRLRPQVHGWWVPQAQLDAAKA
ncbi:carotenoid oxygenase [Novosphingobium sp. FSY-8]|uniref:Dioxygenase n=1 Tax=Novosphingobium ovatum TaxID=1908523 RepID=A0ABW9XDG8_9SPHN|nr:carotenoid oxygenase family protein [Novosphingobium ovatum]NBC36581.1 carotenoid oxygenase [Novosphingobium ovatum]